MIALFSLNVKIICSVPVVYAPYWKHIAGFWEKKDQENVLFIKYEDMKRVISSFKYHAFHMNQTVMRQHKDYRIIISLATLTI